MERLIRKKSMVKQIKKKNPIRGIYRRGGHGMVYSTIAILIVIQLILSSTGIGELLTRATEELPVELDHEISIKEINIFIDNGLDEPTYIIKESQVTGNALPANSNKIHFEILWAWNEEYTEMIPAGSFLNLKLPWESIEFKKTEDNVLKDGEHVYGVWGIKESEPLHLVFDDTDPTECNIGGTFEFVGSTGKLSGKTITLEVGEEKFTIDTTDGLVGFTPTVAVVPPPPGDPPPEEPEPKPPEEDEEDPDEEEPPAEPPTEPISTVIPRISIDKTIDGIPIEQWFEENLSNDHYQSALDYMLFDIYYLGATDPDNEGSGFDANKIFEDMISGGGSPVYANLKLEDGKIVFDPEVAGWYAIVENPMSEINGVFAKISPLFVYVSRTGISSSIHQEDSNKKMFVYSIPHEITIMNSKVKSEYEKFFKVPGGQQRQLTVIYSDGCVENRSEKPDNSRQQLCTEGFITVIGADGTSKESNWGGEPFYSLCADLGAHFVNGSYAFDDLNHYFLDSDIEFLVSVFDYINRMNETKDFLMWPDGRALAQIILWNKVIERDHHEGFTDSWVHPPECDGVGGVVKVLGHESWFNEDYAAFIECALGHTEGLKGDCEYCGGSSNVQEFYIQQYIANKNSGGSQSYVSNVLFIVGTGDKDKVDQQRQLVVFFDHGVTFDNRYVYRGGIDIPMRKEVVSNVSILGPRDFEFIVTQVEGLEEAVRDKEVPGGNLITEKVSVGGDSKITDFAIHIPDLMPDLSKDFEAVDKSYFFKITENLSGHGTGGWQYESKIYWIEVLASEIETDGGRSVVCEIVKKIYSDGEKIKEEGVDGRITFTNEYQVTSTGIMIEGIKTLRIINNSLIEEPEFTFNAMLVDGIGSFTELESPVTKELVIKGATIKSEDLIYDHDSQVGTGRFTIQIEGLIPTKQPYIFMITEEGTDGYGWTYSKEVYWIEVTVVDNGDGTATASYQIVAYGEGTEGEIKEGDEEIEDVEFTNVYDVTPASLIIPGRKVVTGLDPEGDHPNLAGKEFTFKMVQVEGLNDTILSEEQLAVAKLGSTNFKNGEFEFEITGLEEKNSPYFFRVTEDLTDDGKEGWTYSKAIYWVQVDVTLNREGTQTATYTLYTYDRDKDEIVLVSETEGLNPETLEFENSYATGPAEIEVMGEKKVTGVNPNGDDPVVSGRIFTFTVTQVTGKGQTTPVAGGFEKSVEVVGGTRFGAGQFKIPIKELTVADSPYHFMVTEEIPLIISTGWEYSKSIYFLEVVVEDNFDGTSRGVVEMFLFDQEKGQLIALKEGEKITFTNSYVATDLEDLIISAEVYKDTIRRTSAAYVSLPNKEGFNNVGNEDEHYRYDVHFRSTSNVAADEFVVDDPLENVGMGHVKIEGLWTPVVWGSTDGLFNVWFKTNKTNDNTTYSTATVRRNTQLTAAYPNTGYKLWARNLSTDRQYYLDVSKLNLAEGEYITAIRYEYGGVEVGFTSMNTYRDSWNGEHRTQSKDPIDLPSKNKDKIEPLNPLDIVPKVANPNPIVSVIGVADQLFAPAYGVQKIAFQASTTEGTGEGVAALTSADWNSIDGDRVDWTPHPQSPFYPSDREAAASLKEAELKPASYLVSATGPMNSAEIVSSATARIAKHHNGVYLRDHDQDAVVTKVITTFDTKAKGYQPDDYKIESSFVENAKREGFDIRTRGGREALIRQIEGPSPKTGDATLAILLVMAISSLVSLIVTVLLIDTKRRENRGMEERISASNTEKRSKRKAKSLKKAGRGLFLLLLLLAVMAPMGKAYAGEGPPSNPEEEPSENITIEHRYYEGQEGDLVIRDTIVQFGRVYRLIDTSEPVLEDTLPRTRTYTFKIDGNLSKEDLALIDGLEDIINITPVEEVFEREVDKTIVIGGLPTNEVEYLAESKEFQVAAAKEPGLQTTKALARAGVSFEVEAYEDSGLERSLPSSYKATIVYRGTETYTEVIYYLAEVTYEKTETVGEIKQYVVKATYAPTGEVAAVDDLTPEIIEEEELNPDNIDEVIIEDPEEVPEATPSEQTLEELKDAGVPLAQIGDEEVPLYGFPGMSVWALANLIMLILAAILAAITIIRMLVRKIKDRDNIPLKIRSADTKEKDDKTIPRESAKTYRITWFILVMVGTVGMGVLFVMTQNINDLMVIFDIWSIAFGMILAAEVIGALLSLKRIKEPLRAFVR